VRVDFPPLCRSGGDLARLGAKLKIDPDIAPGVHAPRVSGQTIREHRGGHMQGPVTRRLFMSLSVNAAVILLGGAFVTRAMISDATIVKTLHTKSAEHTNQLDLLAMVKAGRYAEAYEAAFEAGDEFFETEFNMLDGVGANVGDGSRFTRIPRADLSGPGQWAQHAPARATGPNATSCNSCHIQLFDDGGGSAVANVHRDPLHTGNLKHFIQRNTPHVFALGATQRLAEEMTTQLQSVRDAIAAQACIFGQASGPLHAKGIAFGILRATRTGTARCDVKYDTTGISGIAADLIVRPFQWKGIKATIRDFNRGAAHDEIGMQAVELAGDGVDGDGDGIADEASVGDMTALSIYLAAQPRPTTKTELASMGLIEPLPAAESARIRLGETLFTRIGCHACHVPRLLLDDPIFSEPSQHPAYRDSRFPAGQDPVALGLDPRHAIRFDLTKDQPDNQIQYADGRIVRLGAFNRDANGRAMVGLFGDLKQHAMGARLAESIDEAGSGRATFLTRNLWGVGSTAPYLHDGRATTLTEAILEHGGEAQASRDAFVGLGLPHQRALVAFLDNLVLFKMEEGEVVIPPPPPVQVSPLLRMKLRLRRIGEPMP
jgi:cytochrome c peroxidase